MEKIILLILSCTCLLCKVDCQGQIKQKLNSGYMKQFLLDKEIISEKKYQDLIRNVILISLDSSKYIQKTSNTFKFVLENKRTVILQDKGKEEDLDYKNYSYLGNVNKELLLLSEDGYETNELFLFNIKDGTRTRILSYPYLNKNSTYFFTYSNNLQVDYLENRVDFYSLNDATVNKRVGSFDFREYFPVEMFWISGSEIAIKFLFYQKEQEAFKFEKWKIRD